MKVTGACENHDMNKISECCFSWTTVFSAIIKNSTYFYVTFIFLYFDSYFSIESISFVVWCVLCVLNYFLRRGPWTSLDCRVGPNRWYRTGGPVPGGAHSSPSAWPGSAPWPPLAAREAESSCSPVGFSLLGKEEWSLGASWHSLSRERRRK